MKTCFKCGHGLDVPARVGRGDECPRCGADLKVCRNCRFYDPGAYNECSEPQADRVVDKEKANFCDYFEFREVNGGGDGGPSKEKTAEEKARDKLKKLFGD